MTRQHSVPSVYLLHISGKDFTCQSLWQVRGYEVICISTDEPVAWMQYKRFADVIQRCANEKLSLTWFDA